MTKSIPLPVKPAVRASFGRAAAEYHDAAVLQKEVCHRLVERLDGIRLAPTRQLDLGCGTGFALPALRERFPDAQTVALDLAPEMAREARRRDLAALSLWDRWRGRATHCLAGDAEQLPFATGSFDLVVSSLALQWCDAPRVFAEVERVLRPGGLFLFATVGPDTLKELRTAFREVDQAAHVNVFVDMHDLGDGLVHAGLADPVMDMEIITMTYAKLDALARELKTIGAHNVLPDRPRGLQGPQRWRAVCAAYERFRSNGVLPATYEIVYGHAWKVARSERPTAGSDGPKPIQFYPRRL
jgi:malonyl-CoA O-methyltransferase